MITFIIRTITLVLLCPSDEQLIINNYLKMVYKISTIVITSALVAAVSASVCVYLVRKKKKKIEFPTEWKKIGYVSKLYIFPLKSGHYNELDSAECTELGLRLIKNPKNPLQLRDRCLIVYHEGSREVKSGRHIPTLVLIEVSVHDQNHLALDAPQMRTLYVKIPENQNTLVANFENGEPVNVLDCGDEAARWISHHITQKDSGYRLGYNDASKRRNFVEHRPYLKYYEHFTNDSTGLYTDISSMMALNQASVRDYQKRAPSSNITAMNFRPNIIIDGPDIKPYDEDNWLWLKFGEDVVMRNVKECTRCVFTNVDPETGKRNPDKEPNKTLAKYRIGDGPEKQPVMGFHLEVHITGIIKSGDSVYLGSN